MPERRFVLPRPNRTRRRQGRLIAALAGWMASAALAPVSVRAADPLNIDVVLPLTGGSSFIGQQGQQGLELAESIINAQGGVAGRPVKFVYHDDQTSPQIAVQHANRIIASGAKVVLGSSISSMCNAMAPLMRNGPLMYCFSPGIHPEAGSYVFSSSVSTKELSSILIKYFRERGWIRIGVLTSSDATGQDAERGIQEAMKKPENAGVTIVEMNRFNPTDTNVAARVERLKDAQPQAIVVWTTGAPFGTVLRSIKQSGLNVPIGTTSGNLSYRIMEQFESVLPSELYLMSGTGSAGIADDLLPKGVAAARRTYREAFAAKGLKPDNGSEVVWDPTMIVVDALRRVGPDALPAKLREAIAAVVGYEGAAGVYDFKAVPQRGLSAENAVVVRWDPQAKAFRAVTKRGGDL